MPQGLRRGLAGEIDLQGAVDGGHLLVLGYDQRIVGVVYALEPDGRIIPQKIECLSAAHAEGGDALAWVQALIAIVNHSFLHQKGYAVAQKLGMHPQMLLLFQARG